MRYWRSTDAGGSTTLSDGSAGHGLESAVAAPMWQEKLHWQASALFRSVNKNHAFRDGNKRTAAMAVQVFLELNGYRLKARDTTVARLSLRVADTANPDLGWIAREAL